MAGHRCALTALLAVATMLPGSVIAQSPDPVQSADPRVAGPGQSAGVATPVGPTLRVVVAPLIAPLVDVYLDGVPLPGLEDFATGSVSVYGPGPPGAHSVDIVRRRQRSVAGNGPRHGPR